MNAVIILLAVLVSSALTALLTWQVTRDYYHHEPSAEAEALRRELNELRQVVQLPALFWLVWAIYTREARGKAMGRAEEDLDVWGNRGEHEEYRPS